MTVCIAAILQGNTIAFVTDQMVSNEFVAAEGFRKHYHLDSELRWLAMCEAQDVRRVPALIAAIQRDLGTGTKSMQEVSSACASAYRSELERMCDAKLSKRGFTLRTFIDTGHEKLGDGLFETILEEINQTDLGIRLLIGGFDGLMPRLMEINGGEVFIPPLNFHVIGEGAWVVEALLNHLPAHWLYMDYEPTIYRLCAAKFAAETMRSVGKDTTVLTLHENTHSGRDRMGGVSFMYTNEVAKLREVWEGNLLASPPDAGLEIIRANLLTIFERGAKL
jgi:hypothetical protein